MTITTMNRLVIIGKSPCLQPIPTVVFFAKGEHKVEFAYSAHVACDRNNFILGAEVTSGNVHDSIVFDDVYDLTVVQRFF